MFRPNNNMIYNNMLHNNIYNYNNTVNKNNYLQSLHNNQILFRNKILFDMQNNLYGDGSSVSSYFYGAGSTYITFAFPYQGLASSTSFASIVMDILDYTNANKYKTTRAIGGIDRNGSGFVAEESGLWRSTAAITSITIAPTTGTFAQYSTFQLYGITTA